MPKNSRKRGSNVAEQWRPVPGYVGFYEVSDLGRVRSLDRTVLHPSGGPKAHRGRIIQQSKKGEACPGVCLSKFGKVTRYSVGTLVLLSFVGPRTEGMQVCHFPDADTKNNRLDNLRWGTAAENAEDREKHGRTARGERNGASVLTTEKVKQIKRLLAKGGIGKQRIATEFKVAKYLITRIQRGELWKHVLI